MSAQEGRQERPRGVSALLATFGDHPVLRQLRDQERAIEQAATLAGIDVREMRTRARARTLLITEAYERGYTVEQIAALVAGQDPGPLDPIAQAATGRPPLDL